MQGQLPGPRSRHAVGTLTRLLHDRPLPKGEAEKGNEKVGADGGELADRKMGGGACPADSPTSGQDTPLVRWGGVSRPQWADERSAVPDIDESTEH